MPNLPKSTIGLPYLPLTYMDYLYYLANTNLIYRWLRQLDSSSPTSKADEFGFDEFVARTVCHCNRFVALHNLRNKHVEA